MEALLIDLRNTATDAKSLVPWNSEALPRYGPTNSSHHYFERCCTSTVKDSHLKHLLPPNL